MYPEARMAGARKSPRHPSRRDVSPVRENGAAHCAMDGPKRIWLRKLELTSGNSPDGRLCAPRIPKGSQRRLRNESKLDKSEERSWTVETREISERSEFANANGAHGESMLPGRGRARRGSGTGTPPRSSSAPVEGDRPGPGRHRRRRGIAVHSARAN